MFIGPIYSNPLLPVLYFKNAFPIQRNPLKVPDTCKLLWLNKLSVFFLVKIPLPAGYPFWSTAPLYIKPFAYFFSAYPGFIFPLWKVP